MYFLDECSYKKQRTIILRIIPHIKSVLGVLKYVEQKRTGGEKAKAAKAARLAAGIAAEAALKGDNEAKAEAKRLVFEATEAMDVAEQEAAENGIDLITDILVQVLDKENESIMVIISSLYGMTPETLENDYGLLEIIEMIQETITNEKLLRFFPQLKRLAKEMPLDTPQK